MSNKIRHIALLAWFGVVLMACNLSSSDEPLTVITPRSNATPEQAVVGYDTPAPPSDANTVSTSNTQIELDLYNLGTEVDENRMMRDIDALVGFHTRHVNSSQTNASRGVGAARQYLIQELTVVQNANPQHFTVTTHPFTAYHNNIESSQSNIVGILQGTEPGAGTIIIGAHYDSRTDDLNDAEGYAPAADDNGSGVAAILEMARVLGGRPQRATVVFVLFAAEEVGRQGSRAFVNDFIIPNNIDVVAMLNLDTIGSNNAPNGTINDRQLRLFSDDDDSNVSLARHLARTIYFLSENHPAPLSIDFHASADREGRYGDHFSFTEADYPAVRFIEALEDTPNREGRDTIDGVEPEYLGNSTRTILTLVMSLAGGVQPPNNMSLRDASVVGDDGAPQYNFVWNNVVGASRYIVALRRPGSATYTTQFVVDTNESGAWHRWGEFEAVAIASVDENGLIGRLSREYIINLR